MLNLCSIFLIGLFCICLQTQAQNVAIYEAGVTIDGIIYTEASNSLQGKSILKTKGQKLNLTSVFVKTFKNLSTSNVCGGYLFYRLFPANGSPTAFNELDCDFFLNISGGRPGFQNQLWQNNIINTNLIRDLDTGIYTFEVYYAADAFEGSSTSCYNLPSIFLKNGNNNFKATIFISSPLNIRFTGFTTKINNEKVFLEWNIEQVINDLQYFVLEKSHNGVSWSILDTIHISGTQYSYIDNSPFTGVNFYRIRATGPGKLNYSIIRRIYVGRVENIVTIYPNPVYRNLRFQMTAIIKSRYDVVVYNTDGTRIAAETIEHDGNDNYVTLPLPVNLSKGVYWLVLYSKNEFYKRSFLIE